MEEILENKELTEVELFKKRLLDRLAFEYKHRHEMYPEGETPTPESFIQRTQDGRIFLSVVMIVHDFK